MPLPPKIHSTLAVVALFPGKHVESKPGLQFNDPLTHLQKRARPAARLGSKSIILQNGKQFPPGRLQRIDDDDVASLISNEPSAFPNGVDIKLTYEYDVGVW